MKNYPRLIVQLRLHYNKNSQQTEKARALASCFNFKTMATAFNNTQINIITAGYFMENKHPHINMCFRIQKNMGVTIFTNCNPVILRSNLTLIMEPFDSALA